MSKTCEICSRPNELCICSSMGTKDQSLINELDLAIENLESISNVNKDNKTSNFASFSTNSADINNKISDEVKTDNPSFKPDTQTSKDSMFAIFIDGLFDENEKEKVFNILKDEGVDLKSDNFSSQMNNSKILIKNLNEVKAYIIVSKLNKFSFKIETALENEIINILNKSDISSSVYSPLDLSKSVCLYTTSTPAQSLNYKYISYISESITLNVDDFSDLMKILESKLKVKAYKLGADAVLGINHNFIDTSTGLFAYIYGTAVKINV